MLSRDAWLAAGLRTPFTIVDRPFVERNGLDPSTLVAAAIAAQAQWRIDFGVWGAVALTLGYANLSRDVWLEAGLDPHAPSFTTIMHCSSSVVGAFEAAGMMRPDRPSLAILGSVARGHLFAATGARIFSQAVTGQVVWS